jgi:hypothetical protein
VPSVIREYTTALLIQGDLKSFREFFYLTHKPSPSAEESDHKKRYAYEEHAEKYSISVMDEIKHLLVATEEAESSSMLSLFTRRSLL